jgi:S1-C subfamily serine protease
MRSFSLSSLVALATLALPIPAQEPARSVQLKVTAALVVAELEVRPVPLLDLELVSEADSARRLAGRTALDGTATIAAPPGRYRLRSLRATTVAGSTYAWDVPVELNAPATVELTNRNASTPTAVAEAGSPEKAVYARVRGGVVRVQAGLNSGSGFLVEGPGVLLVTNDHVVARDSLPSIILDSATRIRARVVARDPRADLAVVRLPDEACASCPRLPLAPRRPEPVAVGDRVMTVGFPLGLGQTITGGVVSSQRDGILRVDMTINPGNSGGPVLDLSGQVVAVATFIMRDPTGPGLAGAISAARLDSLLVAARSAPQDEAPALVTLPVRPVQPFPLDQIKAYADTINPKPYRKPWEVRAGRFMVALGTPVLDYVVQRSIIREMSKDAGLDADAAMAALAGGGNDGYDWEGIGSDLTVPLLSFAVAPRAKRSFWGTLGAAVVGGSGDEPKYVADVASVTLYRNGRPVEPVVGGNSVQLPFLEQSEIRVRNMVNMGYYAYTPDVLAPDSLGTPPQIQLLIGDAKHPGESAQLSLAPEVVAQLWNGFERWARLADPARPFVRAVAAKR